MRLWKWTAALMLIAAGASASFQPAAAVPSSSPVPDTGWRLWLDPQASWQDDTLYLPDEVNLATMPVNAPTGGWGTLSPTAGIAVSLPGTVEEHYWGKPPANALNPADLNNLAGGDGSYRGVSWWYRAFIPPPLAAGERLVFSFPGARLRAEVYVNGKLVGYDVVGETAFEADATPAIDPGKPNILAVRITNPGGTFSWGDYGLMRWGKYELPTTHGFGGLDGGIAMNVRGPVSVVDLAVFNHPDPKTVTLQATVTSTGPAYKGPIALAIVRDGKTVWSGSAQVDVPARGSATTTADATAPSALLWDIGRPNLYVAQASAPSIAHSDRSTAFGFRWFTATGVGSDAKLMLNGRRIVVKSAISWGYWAPNGMFPDQAAADRDAASVKALGLNCIQNHRHMQKPIVLDTFDRAGLMRYCEAGGGCFTYRYPPGQEPRAVSPVDTSGAGGEPTEFYNKYELCKVLGMIRYNRSHPSVIVWNLQNESTDWPNPKLCYTLRQMRAMDPSRIIVSQSGLPQNNLAWSLPYTADLLVDKRDGAGPGWHDTHTAGSSRGVYEDSDYQSPDQFIYNTDNTREITVWGEMATGASPDDHGRIAAWYRDHDVPGYDRAAHEANVAGYNDFITRYGFRSAFRSADDIFAQVADMHYYSTARLLENARMCDNNDYIVLSGWESTAVDNHSGIVDELRNPKTDPAPIKAAAAPSELVVRARRYVVAKGDSVDVDVHLINEDGLRGDPDLTVTAQGADGAVIYNRSASVVIKGGDTFGQLLKDGFEFAAQRDGYTTITATLSDGRATVLSGSTRVYVVDTHPSPLKATVAVMGAPGLGETIRRQFGIAPVDIATAAGKIDDIVIDPETGARAHVWSRSTSPRSDIRSGADPGLFTQQSYGAPGRLASISGLAPGTAKVDLFFVEPYFEAAGERAFDVALNGKTVLANFDIFTEAHGRNAGVVKSFDVDVASGFVELSVPRVEKNFAILAAIRVADSQGHVYREVFGPQAYRDASGDQWNPVRYIGYDWANLTPAIMKRIHDDGTRLVILSGDRDGSDIDGAATALEKMGILSYSGMLGDSDEPWMGRWYFAKKHWLLDGLPSDCVLDWQYQISGGNGFIASAPGLDAVIGYGINHNPRPALGAAVIPYGKGQIVLLCIPGIGPSIRTGAPQGIHPVTATRMLYNCLAAPGSAL